MKRVLELLDIKYGRTRTEKIEEIVEDWMRFRDDSIEDDGELLLGMKELNQRRKDLKMTDNKWVSVWMLCIIKKRVDKFVYQALRNVVKDSGVDVLKNFVKKFKEMHVEGCRKDASSASVMYTEDMDEDLPEDHYTEKEMEMMYTGTESEARKRLQRNSSYRRQPFGRQRSNSRDSRYNSFHKQSRFDESRTGDSKDDRNCDLLCTLARSSQPQNFPRCIECWCGDCNQIKQDC